MDNSYFVVILCSIIMCDQVKCGKIGFFAKIDEICRNRSNVDVMLDLPPTPFTKQFVPMETEDWTKQYIHYLKMSADTSQKPIMDEVSKKFPDIAVHQYFIVNRIFIKNLPCILVTTLAAMVGAFIVRESDVIQLNQDSLPLYAAPGTVQWGLHQIKAHEVWPFSKGAGVIVGSIDSGVRISHETLRDNFIEGKAFGWLDGFKNDTESLPYDDAGHGTHTMATAVGKLGKGIAPDATWMACKACNETGCPEDLILLCAEWMMCPYRIVNGVRIENCTKRPKILMNAWGGSFSSTFFRPILEKWTKVGIIPVFAGGNLPKDEKPPFCSTIPAPADHSEVISVGASDQNDVIAVFSCRGPSKATNSIKPDFVAPGVNIASAWNTSDSTYTLLNGTSSAAAHIAGAIALLVAKNPNSTMSQVMAYLASTSVRPHVLKKDTCSCTMASFGSRVGCLNQASTYPNNVYGHGRIDVSEAFSVVIV